MNKKNILLAWALLALAVSSYAQWSAFSTGTTNGFIVEFDEHLGEIYATGFFTRIGGKNARYLARWDGEQWNQVGAGLPEAGHAMHSFQGALHLAVYQFNVDSNYVYRWNSDINVLSKLGPGFYLTTATANFSNIPSLYDILDYNGQLVVCGEFDRIGGAAIKGIARWNGIQWQGLGGGLSGYIDGSYDIMYPHKMLVHDGYLYVAGNFKMAGNVEANGIARWNGNSWEALGAGFNGAVLGIEFYNGELYAGGEFTQSGDNELAYIARWDGDEWVSPGIGVAYAPEPPYPFVHTLKAIDGKLYTLGGFDKCTDDNGADVPCSGILAYDGASWDGMDGGLSDNAGGESEAIIAYEGGILVGGQFSTAGDLPVNNMALWGVISGTAEAEEALPARVFPNPSHGWFMVQLPEPAQRFTYRLLNNTGQAVQSGSAQVGQAIRTRAGLAPGLYYLQGECEAGAFRGKVVLR
ncbi:MAG: T9SS type A sorting domain-containing protein [Phaeodactylibacter sp.]|nr:T9SS type A sorting domain-containing protein [Phaeodactylibacter sp.]MCB9273567.1 T9SS type A sorting domain-containing protein [Lewinellaceae bacterium]